MSEAGWGNETADAWRFSLGRAMLQIHERMWNIMFPPPVDITDWPAWAQETMIASSNHWEWFHRISEVAR